MRAIKTHAAAKENHQSRHYTPISATALIQVFDLLTAPTPKYLLSAPNCASWANSGLDRKFVLDMLTTKYLHWKYEDEVRMFVGLDEGTIEHGLYFMPFSDELALREIIIGALYETPFEAVVDLASRVAPHAKIIKARLAFKSFKVVRDQRH